MYTEKDVPFLREVFDRDLAPMIAEKLAKERSEATASRRSAAQPKIHDYFDKKRRR